MAETPADPKLLSSVQLTESDISADDLEQRNKALQAQQSLKLRKHYAYVVLWLTTAQIVIMPALFLMEGIGTFAGCPNVAKCWHFTFHVSDDLFKAYIYSAAAVIAIGFWVTRSLFPAEGSNFWEFLLGIFGKGKGT